MKALNVGEELQKNVKTNRCLKNVISILPGLFAYGEGTVRFSEFRFKRLN